MALALCSSAAAWGCGGDNASIDAGSDATPWDGGVDMPDADLPDTDRPDAATPDASVDPLDVLRDLGVEIETGSPTSNVDGETMPDESHPLASTHTSLGEISELFGAGFRRPGYAHDYFLLDDATASAVDLISPTGDESWAIANDRFPHKAAVGADVDGDGRDEVLTAYAIVRVAGTSYTAEDVRFRLMQDATESFAEATLSPLTELGDLGDAVGPCALAAVCLDLAAGDLDGDGDEELVLMSNFNRTLYVLDYAGGDLNILTQRVLAPSDGMMAMVEVADLDGDGSAEIAAAISDADAADGVSLAKYAIYAFAGGALSEQASGFLVNTDTQLELRVNVTSGDFDGDHLRELVFAGGHHEPSYRRMLLMEDGRGLSATGAVGAPYRMLEQALPLAGAGDALESGDFDGDGTDELLSGQRLVDIDAHTSISLLPANGTFAIRPQQVAVGDFDDGVSDGKADIAILWLHWHSSEGVNLANVNLSIHGAPPAGGSGIVERKRYVLFDGLLSEAMDYYDDFVGYSVLTAANVDDDTRVVEYTGDHAVIYSDPIVMTVLASAPFHADLTHAEGHTILGDSTTAGFDTNGAVGGNVGFSVGASVESPLWGSAGSFEGKLTVALAADFLWGEGSQITYTSAIESPAGRDVVVFTAVPFDAYAYRVIASPDPMEVGELFSLNIPRPARVLSVEREQYNANNGDGPDIDDAVLQHTVGDPSSYPSLTERDALLVGAPFAMISNRTSTCGGAGALWSLGCEWSTSHSTGTSFDVSIQSEITSVTGGLLLGISGGYHFGMDFVWHWSDSTFIEGAVGDMLPVDWEASRSFDWGVFSYQAVIPAQARPVTVVSYWVE